MPAAFLVLGDVDIGHPAVDERGRLVADVGVVRGDFVRPPDGASNGRWLGMADFSEVACSSGCVVLSAGTAGQSGEPSY